MTREEKVVLGDRRPLGTGLPWRVLVRVAKSKHVLLLTLEALMLK